MASLNRVLLIGNLTRAPELRYTPKGTAVAEIGLAVNRKWKDDSGKVQEETTFLEITFWGKQAETVHKFCTKGQPLYIEGRLQLDTWDDRDTGKKRTKIRIIAESFQFLNRGMGVPPISQATQASDSDPPRYPDGSNEYPF